MQIYVQDLFGIKFSSTTCYDTVSTYDTTIISLIFNCTATSAFCMHVMHDTTYDTPIVSSLRGGGYGTNSFWEYDLHSRTEGVHLIRDRCISAP
jgi:hypothetical protein